MKKTRKPVHTPAEILEELRVLVIDAEAMVANTVSEATDDAVAALRVRYDDAQERLLESYAVAKRRTLAGAAAADNAIRESPYRSMAFAAGGGLLLGLWLAACKCRRTAALLLVMGTVLTAAPSLMAQRGQQNGQGMQRRGAEAMMLAGTYELETTRGDNPRDAADQATRSLPAAQRDRAYQNLLSRLQSPAMISIEQTGRSVSISSSNAARTSFDADGRTRNEMSSTRRTVATRADIRNGIITVTSRGNRNTDFEVTFQPMDNGDAMLVTRRMDQEDLRRPVETRSYYRRVNQYARWDLYNDPRNNGREMSSRAFVIPAGTRLQAVLDSPINGRTARSGERFTMTVEGPGEYRDARIDGVISQVSAYGSGRSAEVRVDFETIRLRNGQTAQFDAVLDSVRGPGGTTYRVDAENGTGEDRSGKTLQQGAIGAALGAVIGAIAGGGKGAAIGAVVGGAGGAILAQGRDQYIELPAGTQVTVLVTSGRIR